uniref:Methyltransferase FkbM domain-containing protein n=1 Tax=viral metagenome TaxID=1070528 RepID=A0A6C0JJY8_9ZZZZ
MQPKQEFDSFFDLYALDQNYVRNKNISYLKTDTHVGNAIKLGRYWEPWMFKYISENYIPNTNMIDLGANIGTTTLLMSEVLSKNQKIYSFEPIYHNVLFKNVIDNNLRNKTEIYPFGVGNKKQILKIRQIDFSKNNNFGAVSIIRTLDTNETALSIQIIPVDDFNFENVSLIKIDVEHMEIEVLEGCLDLLTRCKPTILLETYQIDKLKTTDIFKKLINIGYDINPISEGHFDFIMKCTSPK